MDNPIVITIVAVAFVLLAFLLGYLYRKRIGESKIASAEELARKMIENANKDAESLRREAVIDAKDEIAKLKLENEERFKQTRKELNSRENRLLKKEESLDNRSLLMDKKFDQISSDQKKLKQKEDRVDKLIEQQELELQNIAGLTTSEAKDILLENVKSETIHESAKIIKEYEEKTKVESKKIATEIIATTIQRYAADQIAESTVTVVSLPNDEMKGRIIGREGRNIRTLETLTGIDLIIDDTPEAVILSGFDPIRREIARTALVNLVSDGRIHPGRIEDMVEKARKEVDDIIRDAGEQATFEINVHNMHPDLVKILGRLNYRTSYGQNVLKHSIEVAHLSGMLAAELGEDVTLAKRAGLLHDVGKAIDHEVEGSHVEIGVELAKKYNENNIIINAIHSHHGDVEPTSIISILVAAADALSAARPGARKETLENYIRRLERLETLSESYDGVEKAFAIQAGREIRVVVSPEEIDDLKSYRLARDIKNQIEEELQYPGHIKVTVVRETRAIEYAK